MKQGNSDEGCQEALFKKSNTVKTVQSRHKTNISDQNQVGINVEENCPLKNSMTESNMTKTKVVANKRGCLIFLSYLESRQWHKFFKNLKRKKIEICFLVFILFVTTAVIFFIKAVWTHSSAQQLLPNIEVFVKNSTGEIYTKKPIYNKQTTPNMKFFVKFSTDEVQTDNSTKNNPTTSDVVFLENSTKKAYANNKIKNKQTTPYYEIFLQNSTGEIREIKQIKNKQSTPKSEISARNMTGEVLGSNQFENEQTTPQMEKNEVHKIHTDTPLENGFFENVEKVTLKGKSTNYLIGVGRADVTGPPADVAMLGYANTDQVAGGVHMRLFARSIIIGQGSTRFVFVSIDVCMGSTLVKLEVLKRLKSRFGDLYTAENVCITATHTHSAPSGFLQDVLFQITPKGFVSETFWAIVDGIEESIVTAHNNLVPGFIQTNKGQLLNSSINRSPTAYLRNPDAERKKYKYNVDKEMILLKFLNSSGEGIGMINWFPVHCTSMNNTNFLISGDNKGYASLLFEQHMDPGALVGKSKFVAIFAQSNEGDVSPNIRGPHCLDTGEPCDAMNNTCNGNIRKCVAFGPGKNMFQSTKIIGERQFHKALELYSEAKEFLGGRLLYVQQYIDMANQSLSVNETHSVRTCKPAMGFSFAAGTTDGPGPLNFFTQGDTAGNKFWRLVRNFVHSPAEEQIKCHVPKPILLDTGNMDYPYSWQSSVVDTQLLQIDRLLVAAVPGEFSTMAGRRLRESIVQTALLQQPNISFDCIISGLANSYSDYITTYEEYQEQKYEGASTIFGPHTLQAYITHYNDLVSMLMQGRQPKSIAKPHDNLKNMLSFVPGVLYDGKPLNLDFGDILLEVEKVYNKSDVVMAKFVSGNPRNSPRHNMTFLTVEKLINNQTWTVVHTDSDWSTKYVWERSSYFSGITGTSIATVIWEIPLSANKGLYRISHYGHYKYFWNQRIYSYSGHSNVFHVL